MTDHESIRGSTSLPKGEDTPEADMEIQSLTVSKRIVGRRLDRFLASRYPRISRTVLQRYIKQGMVTVNDMPTKASYEPQQGDVIAITLPPPPPTELTPEDIPIDIIYEDDWFLAINKKAGIICHPARASQSGTIANAVAFYAKTLSKGSDPFRPGIIHRLDKNTTGIMLIAKTDEAHWRIALQFEHRTIRKTYVAICEGHIQRDGDIINKPLAPHPKTTSRMITPTVTPTGSRTVTMNSVPVSRPPRQAMFKEAITEYKVMKRYRGYTSVELYPKTGRTHQLRVHMASIGHSMAGDGQYGGHPVSEFDLTGQGSTEPFLEFQALHARRLCFMHPIEEKPIEIIAPLPESMLRLIDLLDTHRPQKI